LQVKKGSKTARSRGTCALAQAGLELDPTGAVGPGARLAEESQQERLQGVAKRTRSSSTEAGSSKKKTRRELATEILSQGTSSLAVDSEFVQVGLPDEDSVVPLFSRSHRTEGPVVITAEAEQMEVTERPTFREGLYRYPLELFPRVRFKVEERALTHPTFIQAFQWR